MKSKIKLIYLLFTVPSRNRSSKYAHNCTGIKEADLKIRLRNNNYLDTFSVMRLRRIWIISQQIWEVFVHKGFIHKRILIERNLELNIKNYSVIMYLNIYFWTHKDDRDYTCHPMRRFKLFFSRNRVGHNITCIVYK